MALTKQDLQHIKSIVMEGVHLARENIVDDLLNYLSKNHVTKEEYEHLKLLLSHLPNREEFYAKMDEISGEYKTFQESEPIIAQTISGHTERIEKLEKVTATLSQ
jgi:hypothetical protein